MADELIEIVELPAWVRQDEEPEDWYAKFSKYYLPLGYTRTLTKAYMMFLEAEYPATAANAIVVNKQAAPNSWSAMAREWDWRNRGKAYDRQAINDSADTVQKAREKIMQLSLDAVIALGDALKNPKQSVAAANSILDRSGLPAKSVHVLQVQPFTSDDFARAVMEVDEWKKQLTSDSNG